MFEQIYERLLKKYGHLDSQGMKAQLEKDGLGELVHAVELNQDLIDEPTSEIQAGLSEDLEVMSNPDITGIPVSFDGKFRFEQNACLERCTGECCKHRNYLMITLSDIYNIVNSHGGAFFGIRSTRDLFEGKPPLLEVFVNEEYQLAFPYIRYSPVGTSDPTVRPEEASDNVCPFLRPVKQVYDHHHQKVPERACAGAMGCMLMKSKPYVCRSSPIGKAAGLETGNISYEYVPPTLDCPACESDTEVQVSDYITSIELPGEAARDRSFHRILMQTHKKPHCADRDRLINISKNIYNIDGLLARYGFGPEHRPSLEFLTEIFLRAAKGDFSGYEDFINSMERASGIKVDPRGDMVTLDS